MNTNSKTIKTPSDIHLAFHGRMPSKIPHWEHFSNPDAIELMTGIDPWKKPRTASLAFQKLAGLEVGFEIPEEDTPIERLKMDDQSMVDTDGHTKVRWGTGLTNKWDWGNDFKTIEEVIAYQPLEHLDLTETEVIMNYNYSLNDEEFIKPFLAKHMPPVDLTVAVDTEMFYNTMFMWPLLTFGWELFLELAGGYKEELGRLMADFAVYNRKAFSNLSKLPITAVICHDDICMASGPVCSPAWLREFIYPYYEEFFDIIHSNGKKVIFMCDGNIDKVADDVVACGADGFASEPVTDWDSIVKKYPGKIIAGQGDNRILTYGTTEEIKKMVDIMAATGMDCPGYFMCVGNHIPWNVPAENVKLYFDYSAEKGMRR
jgi:hypothetical protein